MNGIEVWLELKLLLCLQMEMATCTTWSMMSCRTWSCRTKIGRRTRSCWRRRSSSARGSSAAVLAAPDPAPLTPHQVTAQLSAGYPPSQLGTALRPHHNHTAEGHSAHGSMPAPSAAIPSVLFPCSHPVVLQVIQCVPHYLRKVLINSSTLNGL